MIKPDCAGKTEALSDLINLIRENGLVMLCNRRVRMPEPFWRQFYHPHSKDPKFPDFQGFVQWMASEQVVFVIVEGNSNNVVNLVRSRILAPLREKYKTNERQNGFHASSSCEAATKEVGLIQDTQRE